MSFHKRKYRTERELGDTKTDCGYSIYKKFVFMSENHYY